jgi:hypothetical protein
VPVAKVVGADVAVFDETGGDVAAMFGVLVVRLHSTVQILLVLGFQRALKAADNKFQYNFES